MKCVGEPALGLPTMIISILREGEGALPYKCVTYHFIVTRGTSRTPSPTRLK